MLMQYYSIKNDYTTLKENIKIKTEMITKMIKVKVSL
jgi:hypothetical protein